MMTPRRNSSPCDSYLGPNQHYTYDHIDEFWRHFNRRYIVLYKSGAEPDVLALLGGDADMEQNALNTLEEDRAEATAQCRRILHLVQYRQQLCALAPTYQQQAYDYAAVAYKEALKFGLPYRMSWYQFGLMEAFTQWAIMTRRWRWPPRT